MIVTFLTDFGLEDDFVGTCHGVIARIAPDARVIDVTHGIAPQAVLQGAFVLRHTLPYLPVGVHLAVVDPGVGGARKAIAVEARDGRVFVGPDNGLLLLAADTAGVVRAHELAEPRFRLAGVSRTFHARDLFAPAAAHLAGGVAIDELGPALDPAGLVRLAVPEATVEGGGIAATILAVDRFGNLATNVRRDQLAALGLEPGTRAEVDRRPARCVETFGDVDPGGVALYEDSYGYVAVAVRDGSAAELLGAHTGSDVTVRRP